jgi:hypothetical protein
MNRKTQGHPWVFYMYAEMYSHLTSRLGGTTPSTPSEAKRPGECDHTSAGRRNGRDPCLISTKRIDAVAADRSAVRRNIDGI